MYSSHPREGATFRADPDVALSGYREPILLDEWQEVPSVLGAVKRAVDRDPRPGRFLLTGSVRADLEAATWPGTGRVVRVPMYGMTVRELNGDVEGNTLLDRLTSGGDLSLPNDPPDLRGYLELALRSGFPDAALAVNASSRTRWLEGYIDQLLTRDAAGIGSRRDPARLRRYFEAYALNTAGIVSDATLLVDVLAEIGGRDLLAFEVKADAAPGRDAAAPRLVERPTRRALRAGRGAAHRPARVPARRGDRRGADLRAMGCA